MVSNEKLAFTSAANLQRLLRQGHVRSLELLELYLDRVSAHNATLNAVTVLDVKGARERARSADAALKHGTVWGPLHGIPMTVKDAFDVAGLPTTWGVPRLQDNRASTTAAAVDGLQRAGAVIFGKTNVPYMLGDRQTFNAIYGTTNNPWDLSRSPGGSSGGSAAALAAGLTALEIGSDLGSSVRNPAHYCGVYGHKPTFGVVPQAGHGIPGVQTPIDLNVVGPLARNAEDLAIALDAMTGPEPDDRAAWRITLPRAEKKRLSDYRVAVMPSHPESPVDDTVRERVEFATTALVRAGAMVNDAARPALDLRGAHALFIQLLRAVSGAYAEPNVISTARNELKHLQRDDDSYRARAYRGMVQDYRSWFAAHQERTTLRRKWAQFFEEYDVLMCPVMATAAFPHDQHRDLFDRTITVNGEEQDANAQFFWAGLATLAYLPATVVPAGLTPNGLPVGVQVIGRYLHDHETIRFASLLSREIGGFVPPPLYA